MNFSSRSDFPFPTRYLFKFAQGPVHPAPQWSLLLLPKPAYAIVSQKLCLLFPPSVPDFSLDCNADHRTSPRSYEIEPSEW